MRIVVVCGLAIRKKWLRYLGYYTLPEYVDYELWDISAFCEKGDNKVAFDDEIEGLEYVRKIASEDKFLQALLELDRRKGPTYVFGLSTNRKQERNLWRACANTSLNYCIKDTKDHPRHVFKSFSLRTWLHGQKKNIRRLYSNIKIAYKYSQPCHAFFATYDFINRWGVLHGLAPRSYIHNLNYDKYLALDSKVPESKPYAVYIDQNLPADHQVRLASGTPFMSEQQFWGQMQTLFRKIRKRLNLEDIVVCAHPNRSQSSIDTISSFCTIGQFETEERVRDCSVVIGHASTALDFAVLFEKPVCIVSMQGISNNPRFQNMTEQYAEHLGRQVNMIDESTQTSIDLGIDKKAYQSFKRRLIKMPNTPEVNSWKYIVTVLKKSYNKSKFSEQI